MNKPLKTVALASILALGAAFSPVFAANTAVTVGMQLEPPGLDPTAGAAGAIDQVVYANIFEGLTRFDATGAIIPALAENGTFQTMASFIRFTFIRA